MDDAELVEQVSRRDRRALARLLSHIEDGREERVRALVAALHPVSGSAHLVGLTGAPGVGKSSLAAALVAHWRAQGHSVAVLAIDPTSPFTGGALLGDRVRLERHVLDDGVFVRSMATRGHLGGLSWAAPPALVALDAAGFDIVVVETVGVGQAEVEVAAVADTTIVGLAPGMGDAVQAAKAGILEVADVLVVNKADRPGADRALRDLADLQEPGIGTAARQGLTLPDGVEDWDPPVRATVATATGEASGVGALAQTVAAHRDWLARSGLARHRARARAALQLRELAQAAVRGRLGAMAGGTLLDDLAAQVADRVLDPYTAADRLLAALEIER